MAVFTKEERQAFFGSIARNTIGVEHLLGLTSAETTTYLSFRRVALLGGAAQAVGASEHVALHDMHLRACKARLAKT